MLFKTCKAITNFKDIKTCGRTEIINNNFYPYCQEHRWRPATKILSLILLIIIGVISKLIYDSCIATENSASNTEEIVLTNHRLPFKDSSDTLNILIVRFEHLVDDTNPTKCIGKGIEEHLKEIDLPTNPIYEHYVPSPLTKQEANKLKEKANADIVIYGNVKTIEQACTGAEVCFRYSLSDIILDVVSIPEKVKKDKFLFDYNTVDLFDIGNSPFSATGRSMKAWLSSLIALKGKDKLKATAEVELMVNVDTLNESNQTKALKFLNRGKVFLEYKNYSRAIDDFTKAIKYDPLTPFAHEMRAITNIYFKQNYEYALKDLNKSIELNDKFSFKYTIRAGVKYHMGQFSGALKDLNKSIQLNPNNSFTYSIRATINSLLGNYNLSINDARKAIELDSNQVLAHLIKGYTNISIENYKSAQEDFTNVIALDSIIGVAYSNRAISFAHFEKYDLAIKDFSKAIELLDSTSTFGIGPDDLYFARNNSKTIQNGKDNSVEQVSLEYELYYQRGMIYYLLEESDNALLDFNMAAEIDSSNALLFSYRGDIFLSLGMTDAALSDYTQFIKLDTITPLYYFKRGDLYSDRNEDELALLDINKAIELNNSNPKYFALRAYIYAKMKKSESALMDINVALKKDSTNTRYLVFRAVLYSNLKNHTLSITDINKSISLEQTNPKSQSLDSIYYSLRGYNNYSLLNYNQARLDFDAAIEIDSTDLQAYSNRGLLNLKEEDYQSSFRDFSTAEKLDSLSNEVFRNWACYYSMHNEVDKAIINLRKSIELGYDDKSWLLSESFFDNLRTNQKFQELLLEI